MNNKISKEQKMNQIQSKSECVCLSNQTRNEKTHKCPICGKVFKGYGNNPYPVRDKGRCCDECNRLYVTNTRYLIHIFSDSEDKRTQKESRNIERYMKVLSLTQIQNYLRPYFPKVFGVNNKVG